MAWKTVYAPALAAAFAAFAIAGGIQASEKIIKAEEKPAPAMRGHGAIPLSETGVKAAKG